MDIFDEKEWNEFQLAHPELRFWQAMAAYLQANRILVEYREDEEMVYENTFYWKDKKQK